MDSRTGIPAFGLYGEDHDFPDVVHVEPIHARAPLFDWKISAHRHERIAQLLLLSGGKAMVTVEDQNMELSDGQFLFVPERSVHALLFEPETTGAVFSFPRGTVQSLGSGAMTSVLSTPITGSVSRELAQLAETLGDIATDDMPFRSHLAVSLSHAILGLVAGIGSARGDAATKIPSRLQKLDALIANHMADGWSASDFADALSLSTGHLSRLCRSMSGVGASAYLERKRIGEACRMLAFTQLPVSRIGNRVGYPDPSYFSKRFRRVTGQSPLAYRDKFTNRTG